MFAHHPVLAESGEIEIAQRQALHAVTSEIGLDAQGAALARRVIEVYLAAMRREWKPDAIEIGEGDYVVVAINGCRVSVGREKDADGGEFLQLGGIDCDLEGEQPGAYYPRPRS